MSDIDLQIHSNFSDGTLAPDEIMRRCREQGIRIAVITDHDTVAHVPAAREAAEKYGIKTVSGIEISTVHEGQEVHLLGYDFDSDNAALTETVMRLAHARQSRAGGMVKKLMENGWKVSWDEVEEQAKGPIGRPHIARAVLARTDNQERLQAEKIVNMSQFIVAYLEPGKPAYVERFKLETRDAISLLHEAGGLAVLSHPGWTFENRFGEIHEVVAEFKAIGLDGLEAFYQSYTRDMTMKLHKAALKYDLCETAGSDFHDPDHELFGKLGGGETYGLTPIWPEFMKGWYD